LEAFENWTEFLDESHGVDIIYLNYTKAFDTRYCSTEEVISKNLSRKRRKSP